MAGPFDPESELSGINGGSVDMPSTEAFGLDKKPSNSATSPTKSVNIVGSGVNGFHKYNAQYVLRDYFKDRDTYNFKHGLEFGLDSNLSDKSTENGLLNLDEDPTIFGFDIVILDKSPLFNDIDGFIQFGGANAINEVSSRQGIYNDFINQFAKFFNVDDRNRGNFKIDSRFASFKTHYLKGVQGLDKLIHSIGIGDEKGRQMTDFGKDKLTFSLTEDIGINTGYLSGLYRTLLYSKRTGRQVIPENLVRFDMVIIISEIRKFNRVSNSLKTNGSADTAIKVFNDNISRYIFTLYDCQFDFNKYSFDESIDQGGFDGGSPGESKGLSFDVFYKYVGMEIEKFNFNPDLDIGERAKYINTQRMSPDTNHINNDPYSEINLKTGAMETQKFPDRPLDFKFAMNTVNNSTEGKEYQFDFPMIKSRYAKAQNDIRNRNAIVAEDQSAFRTGLNTIIGKTNEELQRKFVEARSQLVSDLAAKVRGITGLRNISAPVNVYFNENVAQLLIGKLGDFANLAVGTLLSGGAGFVNQAARGIENSVFDISNRGVDTLSGTETVGKGQKYVGNTDIPNVYRK